MSTPRGDGGLPVLRVDTEFQALIPPLAPDELEQLETNLAAEGCRDPLVVWDGVIVDGHNRYAICARLGVPFQIIERQFASRDDAKVWIIQNQLGRRNLSTYQHGVLALQLKEVLAEQARQRMMAGKKIDPGENFPQGRTREALASIAGVSDRTIEKIEAIERHAPPELKAQIQAGETSIHAAYTTVRREQQRREREMVDQQRRIVVETQPAPQRFELVHGDFREVVDSGRIPAGSVDLIATDPPYKRGIVEYCRALAERATRLLKPGGSLLVMAGQFYLPEALWHMSQLISYQWTLAYLTPGGQAPQIWPRKVNTFWKPVLWFVNGEYQGHWIGDVPRSATNDNDKRFHAWGQSESGMAQLLERFAAPGATVLDPFCGGGTTGVVALRLGCRFIGIDNDEAALVATHERLTTVEVSE